MRLRERGSVASGLACTVGLAVAVAGCSSGGRAGNSTPAFCRHQYPAAACVVADGDRFVIAIGKPLLNAAEQVNESLSGTVIASLDRIGKLLPGPRTDIVILAGTRVIPQAGVNGFTDPATGQVWITLDIRQSPDALKRSVSVWLPQALAHEVDHSVRIQAGPGFGRSLLEQLITEGMSSAFDIEVEPTIRLPWIQALTARQEKSAWRRARPLLDSTGLYSQWFFGGSGVPHWAGFQIGYHIVLDYLISHGGTTAASLATKPAAVIFSNSHYSP